MSHLILLFVPKRIGYSNDNNINTDNTRAPVWLARALHVSSVCRWLHLRVRPLRALVDAQNTPPGDANALAATLLPLKQLVVAESQQSTGCRIVRGRRKRIHLQ